MTYHIYKKPLTFACQNPNRNSFQALRGIMLKRTGQMEGNTRNIIPLSTRQLSHEKLLATTFFNRVNYILLVF